MEIWSLSSGSSGNAFLVRTGRTFVLLECGLPPSRLRKYLAGLGLVPESLSAILVTHEHSDHALSVVPFSGGLGLPVYATQGTLDRIGVAAAYSRVISPGRAFHLGGLEVMALPVPHDAAEPVAFHFTDGRARICVATDLGHIPGHLQPVLASADLLVIEANHDRQLLAAGPYPAWLKDRVAGELGHLSNDDVVALVRSFRSSFPREVWLAHLSENNNRPSLARKTVLRALDQMGVDSVPVRVAARHGPSLHWDSDFPQQLSLPM